MGKGRNIRTIAYRLLALLLVLAFCSADMTALAYAADGSGGTARSSDATLLLIPETGFSFYQENNLVAGQQAWTKAATL